MYILFILLFRIYFLTLLHAQIPTNGMVACYPFSGNANDMSGNNYHGTVYGATLTTDRFGRLNNAYSFNGSSNYINLPFAPFNLQNFTYSVWAFASFYPSYLNQNCIISIGSVGGDHTLALSNAYHIDGKVGWAFNSYNTTTPTHYWWSVGVFPPLNTWYHLVLTRDNSSIKCYINGQLVYTQSTIGTLPFYGTGTPLANIGRRSDIAINQFFNGKIDDIHIYNRALTSSEVTQLYNGTNTVTITANPGTTINQGENITFTATINGSITNPTYQWQVNGSIVGGNNPTYSTTNLNNGDVVSCLLIPGGACEVPVYSNSLTITVNPLPNNGLIACYPFSGNANDMSGNNYHGTLYGATLTTDRFGRTNNAYYFNGVDNYILLPSIVDIPVKTINLWFYSDTTIATHVIFDSDNPNLIYGKTTFEFNLYNQNSYSKMFAGSAACQRIAEIKKWNMATSVIVNDTGYFYLNGVFFGKIYNDKIHSADGLSNIVLGSVRNHTTYYYKGKIDDIHIYNRDLTPSEILNLYYGAGTVTITADPGINICTGDDVSFTATINGNITNPIYQWQINGNNVGSNSPVYTNNSLANGDIVRCLVNSDQPCEAPINSNALTMNVGNPSSLSVNITASPGNNICAGENVVFTASGNNGGPNAVYQWKINGINVGTNSNTLSVDTLTDGSQVICLYSSLLPCISNNPAISNIIEMIVGNSLPLDVYITASPNNFICEGTPVIFTAHGINGGNNANYQWMNNGVPIGSNSPILSLNIHRNDIIYCIYSSPLTCVTNNPVSSGVINMVILSNPIVDAGNNAQIILPEGIYLNPTYSDGTPPYEFIWTPGNSLSNPFIANPYATPITTTTYLLSVTDASGCIAQDSITVYVDTENEIFVPNTFSPNDDNQNDVLYVRGMGIKEMEFSIYDRWGEKIFFSNSLLFGWDGCFNGNKLAPGVFAYYLKVITYDNETLEKTGNITLIR